MSKRSVVLIIAAIIAISVMVAATQVASVKGQNKIAVIYVDGVIVGGRGESGLFSESGGTDKIIRQLHQARDDASVRAIVLRINSPGGSAPASQEVGTEIKKLRAGGKIVVASMADVAASGGYWVAAVTDKIYANPATLTGSIGVYIPYANWEELYKKVGVYQEKIKSGPHKDILAPERQMTAEERAIIQGMVDELYGQFVTVVAEGRHMEKARVKQLADGRIYTGSQAKQLGLVDELGTMHDAIDGAANLAGIKGKPAIEEYDDSSPWQHLLGSGSASLNLENILSNKIKNDLPITAPMAMMLQW